MQVELIIEIISKYAWGLNDILMENMFPLLFELFRDECLQDFAINFQYS
jgi:hypothetical protein